MTKLYIPRAPANLVPRPRLVQQLNEGLNGVLTLVSAPAGFGKTTLLSEWHADLAKRQFQVVWLSLDNGDNDPARFLAYLIAALQMIEPRLGESAQAILQSPQPPPLEAVLTALINDVNTLSNPFVVVVDDYDVIQLPLIHELLTFLLDHLPRQMRLVITSRTDPPLPLARLRARGQLTELRVADLRFNPDEAAAFLNQVLRLDLTAEDIAALDARTEGWVVGLQLAALSMRGREDVSNFIKAFAGSDRYIVDYLMSEVLQRQPEQVQRFLLHTSILDRLNGPLCKAVACQADAQELLETLEQTNLFIIPLDSQRRWYRYHHLFADSLRHRLQRADPDMWMELHRRASLWYEQHGLMDEAVNHSLEAKDLERAARLIERSGIATLGRGQVRTLLGWLNALPEELLRMRPGLCVIHAAALTFTDQLEMAEARLQDIEARIRTGDSMDQARAFLGQVAVIRAALARIPGNLARCVAFAHQALELLPESEIFWRGPAAVYAGLTYRLSGDVTRTSERQIEEAVKLAQASGNMIATLAALVNLAKLRIIQGRLREAAATYRRIWQWATERDELWLLMGSPAYYIGMGDLLREWNDLEAAQTHLSQGIQMNKWIVDAEVITGGYMAFAALKQAQGDLHGGLEIIATFLQLAQQRNFASQFIAWAAANQARLWVAQGNLRSAAQWAVSCGLSPQDELAYPRLHEYLALIRVCMAQGKLDDALQLLERLVSLAGAGEQMWVLIEMLVLQALALQMQDDLAGAMAAVERALAIAEPESYIRTFVDEGKPMLVLLRQAAARGLYTDYVAQLLSAFPELVPTFAVRNARWMTSERLSEREAEVLRLMASGKSSPEIADVLVVGVSTVRTHIKNIYSKLDVHSREQAIERAKSWKLI